MSEQRPPPGWLRGGRCTSASSAVAVAFANTEYDIHCLQHRVNRPATRSHPEAPSLPTTTDPIQRRTVRGNGVGQGRQLGQRPLAGGSAAELLLRRRPLAAPAGGRAASIVNLSASTGPAAEHGEQHARARTRQNSLI